MRRKGWGRWEWLYITLMMGIFIVSFPVAFPVAMIQHGRIERRKKRRVLRASCARCQAVLGSAALERANAEWSAYLERLFRENPGIRFRLVREVDAVCVPCGQPHHYDEASDAFAATRDEPFTQAAKNARSGTSHSGGG